MELFDLTGQVAVVTGSSQGIGRACAERLAEHGANVVFSSRSAVEARARAAEVNERHGDERAIGVACDVTDRAQLRGLVEAAMTQWGRVDCVVGNALAPISTTAWIEKIDEDELNASLEGNVTNNAYLAKLVVPIMRAQGGGTIIYISSTSGVAVNEDYIAYGTVKAALNHLARVLAVQLGPLNIRVNTVAPGIIASYGREDTWADPELRAAGTGQTPLGRPGTPDEIAACVVWLASPGGTFATGQTFVVDGGQTLKGMEGPHEVRKVLRKRLKPVTLS